MNMNTGMRRKRGPAINVMAVQPLFAKYAKDGLTIKEITSRVNSELGLTLEPGQLAAKMTQLRQRMFNELCQKRYARHIAVYTAKKQEKELEALQKAINNSLDELFPAVTRAGKTKAAVATFLAELNLPEFDLPELEVDSDTDSEEV